ncbi:MAG: ABC transporter ATP-binding protein [Actinobacteria bacterium]|nr:ABC transporter ATP-binding protein [Actinomycetota bacterium]
MTAPALPDEPTAAGPAAPVLALDGLSVVLAARGREATILDGVSLALTPGETVALVGESGAGKTVLALAVMGLLPDGMRVTGGRIVLGGTDLLGASASALRGARGGAMAMIFQDPQSSLHPAFRVGAQVAEAIRTHQAGVSKADASAQAVELLRRVGIPQADARARDYPHQMSGGMRQRVMIAMAIANRPRLLIADEATTALDVTVQAQVLEVLKTAQQETGAAMLVVTHDLGVVASVADRVVVMYAGRIAESGPVDTVLTEPAHPYTRGLLAAVPRLDEAAPVQAIPGQPPSPFARPSGCAFRTRCPLADERCEAEDPVLVAFGADAGHAVACHHAGGPA